MIEIKKFNDYIKSKQELTEALITLNNKRPKYGQIVMMAGGAGSGKGFVIDNLLGIEGKVFDVDELKEMALKSNLIKQNVKKKFGIDLNDLELKNPDDVSTLHDIIKSLKLDDKRQSAFFDSVFTQKPENKPNIIFDMTLKDAYKLDDVYRLASDFGYKKENIHIIWVLDDVDQAAIKNKNRKRVVREEILRHTHKQVSLLFNSLLKGEINIKNYMDGDIWLVFNQINVDSILQNKDGIGDFKKPFYLKNVNYHKLKETGKNITKLEDVVDSVFNKITNYTPDGKSIWSK